MSAGVLGALAGVGPGYMAREQMNIDKGDAKIRREDADRTAQRFEWWEEFANEYYKGREAVDSSDPASWDTYIKGLPQAAAASFPSGLPAPQAQAPALPGYAEGGVANVPAQQVGPPAPEALPAMGPPEARAGTPRPSRRERYDQWFGKMGRYALLNGGLEGLSKFEEMENATSRRQVMGYGLQAVRAMDEGNVGEAMRAGNAALEVTPFDTGLQFVAQDGKLHIQGADGTLGEALKAQHLAAFVDDHMKTPESYLDWKSQYEVERRNVADEGLRGEQIGVNRTNAETMQGHLDIAREKLAPEIAKMGAETIALLQGAEADLVRAYGSGADVGGLDAGEMIRVFNDLFTAINDDGIPGMDWMKPLLTDPARSLPMQSGAMSLVTMNGPAAVNYADAVALSSIAYGPGVGIELDVPDNYMPSEIGKDEKGGFVVFLGKKMYVPPHMFAQLDAMSE